MKICLAERKDSLAIAGIHKSEIKKGFLSSLDASFLEKLYSAAIQASSSFCVVAKEEERVVGFIAGASDLNKFYLYFLAKYLKNI